MITEDDLMFLNRRKKLNKFWSIIGIGMFIALALLYIGLYLRTPNLVNPFHVIKMLETGELEIGTMRVLAVLCPVAFLFLFVIVAIVILYGFAWAKLESRYLKLTDELRQEKKD